MKIRPALKLLSCWRATMPYLSSAKPCAITMESGTCPHVTPHLPVSTMGTSAAAWSVLPHQRPRQPDSALRALLLAYTLELRHARLRASRENNHVGTEPAAGSNLPHGRRKIRSDCSWAPSGECVATVRSVGGVSLRACVRPRPSQNGPRWWCRPTLKMAAAP
jgi:hypothetical protein